MLGGKGLGGVVVLSAFLISFDAEAAVWYVNQANVSGVNDGTSWGTAFIKIQPAVDAAAAGGGQVWVAEGTYLEAISVKSGVEIYGGFQGTEAIQSARDVVAHLTTIDASHANSGAPAYHVVTMDGTRNARLDGFTITGGGSELNACGGDADKYGQGSGVYCNNLDSTNAIAHCTVTGNTSNIRCSGLSAVGGIYCMASSLTISDCTITENYGVGVGSYNSAPSLISCTISHSKSLWTTDAGETGFNCKGGSPSLTNCVLSQNRLGMYLDTVTSAILDHCAIADNVGVDTDNVGVDAGGIYISNGPQRGSSGGDIVIRSCKILRNSGAGISNHDWASSTVHSSIVNCAVAGNSGEGIRQFSQQPTTISNCTITANGDDGVFCNSASTVLTNTIFSANGGFGIRSDSGVFAPVPSHCLFSGNANGAYSDPQVPADYATARELDFAKGYSGANVDGDPRFVDAAAGDYRLLNGSAALDRGLLSGAPSTDIDGAARPGADGLIDIGAYESDSSFVPPADATAPVSRVEAPVASTDGVIDIAWHAGDGESGVQYVSLYYRRNGGSWTLYPRRVTSSPVQFDTFLTGGDGIYEFYTVARDNSGNEEISVPVVGRTFVVTQFAGARVYVDKAAAGLGSGVDWANALTSIQAGITVAQAFGASEVWVAGGSYPEVITMASGVAVYGGFARTESAASDRNLAAHPSILDGAHAKDGAVAPNAVIFYQVSNSRLDGFSVTGCARAFPAALNAHYSGDGATPERNPGGAVFCKDADASNAIVNCFIHGNTAYVGAGIYCSGPSPTVDRCVIQGNTANSQLSVVDRGGGGVYGANNSTKISNSTISDNVINDSALGSDQRVGRGGGCWMVELTNCVVSGNKASIGGGCYSSQLTDCTITKNEAITGGGVSGSSLLRCVVSENAASHDGGGVSAGSASQCTFSSNTANEGGGMYGGSATGCLFQDNTATTGGGFYGNRAEGCTFVGNSATSGGALACRESYIPSGYNDDYWHVSLDGPSNCIFTGNRAQSGAVWAVEINVNLCPDCKGTQEAIDGLNYSSAAVEADAKRYSYQKQSDITAEFRTRFNTIWGNVADTGELFAMFGDAGNSISSSIIRENAPNTVTGVVRYSNVQGGHDGEGNIDTQAFFVDEEHGDFYLQPGSPCIDTGAPDEAASFDMLGTPRPQGARADMGAYEYAGPQPIAVASHALPLPEISTGGLLNIPWYSWGGIGGIQYIELYYRHDGGAWTKYPGTFTSSPIAFDSSLAAGDGRYEFYTVATDAQGNHEVATSTADAVIPIITSVPGSRVYVSKNGDDQTGQNWQHALRSLPAGLALATALHTRELWIAEGDYAAAIQVSSGLSVYGGFAGTESEISERDLAAHPTVLHATGTGYAIVFLSTVSSARVDGIVVDGDHKTTNPGIAAYNMDSACLITNCVVRNCFSASYGSGDAIRISGGAPEVSHCTIADNTGSGVRIDNSNAIIRSCTISGNGDAGICVSNASPRIVDCVVTKNVGGGISIDVAPSYEIRGTRITGNAGSGITATKSPSNGLIRDCVIDGNGGPYSGYGVYLQNASPDIVNCVISRNVSPQPGGIGLVCASSASPHVVNCTIAGNGGAAGGGVTCSENSTPTILNTIVALNTSYGVSSFDTSSRPTLTSCLFHGNGGLDVASGDGGAYFGAQAINAHVPGATGNVDGDPVFMKSAKGDYRLRMGSAAVDAGTPDGAPNTDIVGETRPLGAGFDIGAYELRAPVGADVSGDGLVGAVDIQLVINTALGFDTGALCDFDGSGAVDAVDVQLIINAALG